MTQTTHPLRAIPRPKRILSCYSLVVVDRDGRPHLPLTRIYYEIQQTFSECPGCGAGVCARLPSIPDPMQAARLSRSLFAAAYEACIAHTAMGVGDTSSAKRSPSAGGSTNQTLSIACPRGWHCQAAFVLVAFARHTSRLSARLSTSYREEQYLLSKFIRTSAHPFDRFACRGTLREGQLLQLSLLLLPCLPGHQTARRRDIVYCTGDHLSIECYGVLFQALEPIRRY